MDGALTHRKAAMPTRTIRLPDRFYLPRIDARGREVRDVMPWDGAVSYATDGARVGIQYADGRVVWLGEVGAMDALPQDSPSVAPPLEEDFDGVNLDALVGGLREYMERHPVLKNVWREDVERLDALRRQGERE
ncbi:MAG TPA: hypothetical protein VFQ45_03425 [Longimicrobium sp.]|nr:hypothetical protein [Longimicrobium sp.]